MGRIIGGGGEPPKKAPDFAAGMTVFFPRVGGDNEVGQQLAKDVEALMTIAPERTETDLYSWNAGIFTLKNDGLYLFSSSIMLSANQTASYPYASGMVRHAYTQGEGHTTEFSTPAGGYENNRVALMYSAPASSGSGVALYTVCTEGTTPMRAGDTFSIRVKSDSNTSSAAQRGIFHAYCRLTIQHLGGLPE